MARLGVLFAACVFLLAFGCAHHHGGHPCAHRGEGKPCCQQAGPAAGADAATPGKVACGPGCPCGCKQGKPCGCKAQ